MAKMAVYKAYSGKRRMVRMEKNIHVSIWLQRQPRIPSFGTLKARIK